MVSVCERSQGGTQEFPKVDPKGLHTYTYINIYTNTQIHIYTYTHVHMYSCIRMATCEIWPTPQSEQEMETPGEPSYQMIAARKPQGPPQHNLKTQKNPLWELPGGLWELLGHLHIYRIYIHTHIYTQLKIYTWAYKVGRAKNARGVSILRPPRSSIKARHLSNIGYVPYIGVAIVIGYVKIVTTLAREPRF